MTYCLLQYEFEDNIDCCLYRDIMSQDQNLHTQKTKVLVARLEAWTNGNPG